MRTIYTVETSLGKVEVVEQEDGEFFDLFLCGTGECINEGAPFYSIPSESQVKEWAANLS